MRRRPGPHPWPLARPLAILAGVMSETPTVGDALRAANARLAARGQPASDAEELLSRLLGVGRGELRALRARKLTSGESAAFAAHLARREAGEPVQYITGRAAFRHLDLAVDRRVLIPRPETELLVEGVLEHLAREHGPHRSPRVLDLGTGSGCIALAIAHEHAAARVTATDASESALELARANAEACGLTQRVTFAPGRWFDAVEPDERFDVIVSNPPYVAESESRDLPGDVRDWEPASALFAAERGLADVREILDEAPRHLVTGGLLALELAEARAAEVAAWLEGARDWRGVELRADLAGRPRMLFARREHGPAIAPAQWGEEGPPR
jgi:release factor glutamine methyltransferase